MMFITPKSLLPASNSPRVHRQEGSDHRAKSLMMLLTVPRLKGDCIKKQPPIYLALTAGMARRAERKAGVELKVTVMQIQLQKKCSQLSRAALLTADAATHQDLNGQQESLEMPHLPRSKYQYKGLQETLGERKAFRRGRRNVHK